jgi:hypothetical protein
VSDVPAITFCFSLTIAIAIAIVIAIAIAAVSLFNNAPPNSKDLQLLTSHEHAMQQDKSLRRPDISPSILEYSVAPPLSSVEK